MKRIIALNMFLCLCVAFCDAQTNLSRSLSDSVIIRQDSISFYDAVRMDSLEKIYYRRVYERIHDIADYLNYIISPNRREADRRYYVSVVQNCFHPTAKIIVKNGSTVHSYDLHKYVQRLTESLDISKIHIDSITIPKWDSLAIANDTLGMVVSEQMMISLKTERRFEPDKKGLPIIKEETEDGNEWTPLLFGDIIVTIIHYENENKRKNNRNNLDVIRNLLR